MFSWDWNSPSGLTTWTQKILKFKEIQFSFTYNIDFYPN